MKLKIITGIVLTLFLIGMLTLAFNVQPVRSEPRTWTVDDDGPADFHTIQEAINVASDGDTIFVYNGTYYENVVINKTLSLLGESKKKTIIDGNRTGAVVSVTANDVTVTGFTIQNSRPIGGAGIYLSSNYNNITDNQVKINDYGILLWYPSSNNMIGENVIMSNHQAISIFYSSNNLIFENNITSNEYGIWLVESSNNKFYHNNFLDNTHQVDFYTSGYANFWDNGYPSGGNYWSDFKERYPDAEDVKSGPNQDQPGSDGIWDTPYVIDENNKDNYPIVPEFPTWTSILLIITVLTAAITINKRRLPKTQIH